MRSVKKRRLLLGITFCNLTVLAIEIFQDLTWRLGILRSRNRLPWVPQICIFACGPPLGLPSSLIAPTSAPKSPSPG